MPAVSTPRPRPPRAALLRAPRPLHHQNNVIIVVEHTYNKHMRLTVFHRATNGAVQASLRWPTISRQTASWRQDHGAALHWKRVVLLLLLLLLMMFRLLARCAVTFWLASRRCVAANRSVGAHEKHIIMRNIIITHLFVVCCFCLCLRLFFSRINGVQLGTYDQSSTTKKISISFFLL